MSQDEECEGVSDSLDGLAAAERVLRAMFPATTAEPQQPDQQLAVHSELVRALTEGDPAALILALGAIAATSISGWAKAVGQEPEELLRLLLESSALERHEMEFEVGHEPL